MFTKAVQQVILNKNVFWWSWLSVFPFSFSPSASLFLARQTSNRISRLSLDPCRFLPNEYMLMYWCVSVSAPALVVAKPLPPYYPSLSHLCALHLSNLHRFPPPFLSVDDSEASQAALSGGRVPTSGGWLRSKYSSGNTPTRKHIHIHTHTAAT